MTTARLELRLRHEGAPVGEITIRPRSGRMTAGGAVELRKSRLAHNGKWVRARLRLDLAKLAGQKLTLEVEATDTRGRRQLERKAGTIRVP